MNCQACGKEIPNERLEALPNTTHCVKCSKVKSPVGFMVFDHKTAPTLVLVDPEDMDALNMAERADRRSR